MAMAKEVSRRPEPMANMRAADGDRHKVADQLKAALDEGRLSLGEYDERVPGVALGAVTVGVQAARRNQLQRRADDDPV
jgi:hypothetical protein